MRNLVMAVRGSDSALVEAEPVLVDTDTPGVVRLEVDGGTFEMDERELLAALEHKAA